MKPTFIGTATALVITAIGTHAGSQPPRAYNVFVDAAASPEGDGTAVAPYQTITRAVERAREIRGEAGGTGKIHVHVAPGEYVEGFPIYVNVSNLELHGSTHLLEDENGLPANCGTDSAPAPCVEPGTETLITPALPLTSSSQALLLIAPTIDGETDRLSDVTVRGFVIDGKTVNVATGGVGIFVDRVNGFSIQGNVTRRLLLGVRTDLSSGGIKGHFAYQSMDGLVVAGGSSIYPARVEVKANRLLNNLEQGLVGLGTASARARQRTPTVRPVQTLFDPLQHPEQVPDTLVLSVVGNDMSGSPRFGVRLEAYITNAAFYDTTDNRPMTSHIVADIRGNSFRNNGEYGVTVEGAFVPRANPRTFTAQFDLRFEGNDLTGNGRAGLFVGFMLNGVVTRNPGLIVTNKYLVDSRFTIETNDPLVDFDFDNPVLDPSDGVTPLNNVLTANGVSFTGRHVTCPPGFPCVQ